LRQYRRGDNHQGGNNEATQAVFYGAFTALILCFIMILLPVYQSIMKKNAK